MNWITLGIFSAVLAGAMAWRVAVLTEPGTFDPFPGPAADSRETEVTAWDRLDRLNLLQYRDKRGKVRMVKTPADWGKRRAEIVRGMEAVMGVLPGRQRRVELDMKVEEEVDAGSYVRRLITYQSEPGCRTPAYLCIPKAALEKKTKTAAVLCLHPTDNKAGHKVVVGLGGRAGREYAAELAERGYVTIAPAYPLLAGYQPDVLKLGWKSGTLKAVWDNIRALDLLEKLPFVDASRGFGAIGHSLGGHNAIFTAVLDRRISVLVSSCGFDAFSDYYGGVEVNWRKGRGWCQVRYMPALAGYRHKLDRIPFDFPELLGALAPRPLFIHAPRRDSNFRHESAAACAATAREVYKLLGAEGQLRIEHPGVDHNFPQDMREAAYRVIDSRLK